MTNISKNIIARITTNQKGWGFSPKDFLDIGARAAVNQVMSRLTRKIARGIYDYPKTNPTIGILSPNIDDLAKIVANKTGDRIFHSGAMATNLLGLSTQLPMKIVYATTGKSCVRQVGNQNIVFQHTRIPIFDGLPLPYNLALQSMAYLGKAALDDDMIHQYSQKLSNDDKLKISKVVAHLPSWMSDAIHKIQGNIHR
ncbi:MAG: DUF6088 family protein [Rickettsiales bacterium]